jgi:hypothetical protein
MAGQEIKKILVFACPRTGSTIIQQILTNLFNIPNLIEPYNSPALGFNPRHFKGRSADLYQWTRAQETGVMKLLAVNLDYVNVDELMQVGRFDRVVIIERKNLVDCCVSLALAEQTARYHYHPGESFDVAPFKCDAEFVVNWASMYQKYLTALKIIKNSNVPYDTVCYEDFMNGKVQYVAGVPLENVSLFKDTVSLEFPYQQLCLNYSKVEKRLAKALATPKPSRQIKLEKRMKKRVKRLRA